MSGYLTNLLARSRGSAEVMRPRIASLFEPVEAAAEATGQASAELPAPERDEEAAASQTRIAMLEIPREVPLERPTLQAPVAIEQRLAPQKLESTPPSEAAAPPRAQAPSPPPAPQALPPKLEPPQPQKPEPQAKPLPAVSPGREKVGVVKEVLAPPPPDPIAPRQAPLTPPARRPRLQPIANAQKAPPAEPEVHVTIGRLEVRAVTEPPPRKKERAPSTVMSLSDYLKSRAGGGQ